MKQDLPPLVAAIRQHGLQAPMITTDITDDKSPYAEEILSTAAELGINHYRWAQFRYTNDQPIAKQLQAIHLRVQRGWQNLTRDIAFAPCITRTRGSILVGAPIWDLQQILKGLDPALVGVNYDVRTRDSWRADWADGLTASGSPSRTCVVLR